MLTTSSDSDKRNHMAKILYVITLYGCRLEDAAAFMTLLSGHKDIYGDIFVYDNSPQVQTTAVSVGQYVRDTGNGGLGKAYNAACEYAKNEGYDRLLLMDQDTFFPANAKECYTKAVEEHPQMSMIVPRHVIENGKYISPTPYRLHTSHICETAPVGIVKFSEACPINSGILLTVDSFSKAGGYDENIWLDFSDIAFIEKYRKSYPEFYVMDDVTCRQTFSATETDKDKVYHRFCIYLECARNFRKGTSGNCLSLTFTTLRPTLSRTLRELTLKYLRAYLSYYLLNKKNRNVQDI